MKELIYFAKKIAKTKQSKFTKALIEYLSLIPYSTSFMYYMGLFKKKKLTSVFRSVLYLSHTDKCSKGQCSQLFQHTVTVATSWGACNLLIEYIEDETPRQELEDGLYNELKTTKL